MCSIILRMQEKFMNWRRSKVERKYDQLLNIRTTGIREWKKESNLYNRYEATPYVALKKLLQVYKIDGNDRLVDFGSGRGRVSFFIHHHHRIPVTGVEMNDQTFDEALNNKLSYRLKAKHIPAPIAFDYGLAENYDVADTDNLFYFFNPFSVKIFKKVIQNIMQSVERKKRQVDIILYYPLNEYKQFLKQNTPFQLINRIKTPSGHGKYGKFVIYRLA